MASIRFPEMLPGVYGLTELHRDAVATADLVANPGCYPTAALLALTPLKTFGLVDVVIDAKSGVSGAGKSPSARTHFCSVDSELMAYGVAVTSPLPQIAPAWPPWSRRALTGPGPRRPTPPPADAAVADAHLCPAPGAAAARHQRDDLRAARSRCRPQAELRRTTSDFYAGERFVEVCDAPPELKDVAGTNFCRIFAHVDERGRPHRRHQRRSTTS